MLAVLADHHDADLIVGVDLAEAFEHLPAHLPGDRVHSVRAGEGDHRDLPVVLSIQAEFASGQRHQ